MSAGDGVARFFRGLVRAVERSVRGLLVLSAFARTLSALLNGIGFLLMWIGPVTVIWGLVRAVQGDWRQAAACAVAAVLSAAAIGVMLVVEPVIVRLDARIAEHRRRLPEHLRAHTATWWDG